MTDIAFLELTSVFDTTIWLFLINLLIAIFISIKIFTKKTTHYSIFLVWKAMIEKEERFPRVVNKKHVWHITGLFLPVGIVLSNSYKNSNVYNMVLLRRPILYNFLQIQGDGSWQVSDFYKAHATKCGKAGGSPKVDRVRAKHNTQTF